MKQLLAVLALMLCCNTASAHGYYYTNGGDWVVPMVVGGVIGYVIKGQQQQRPLIINQPARIVSPPGAAPVYQYQWVFDPNCNCQYQVLVQVN